jgi:hypothetical protein
VPYPWRAAICFEVPFYRRNTCLIVPASFSFFSGLGAPIVPSTAFELRFCVLMPDRASVQTLRCIDPVVFLIL